MLRNILTRSAILLSLVTAALVSWVAYLALHDYSAEFLERKGNLASARTELRDGKADTEQQWLTLTSHSGLRVSCGLLVPRHITGRAPAIILLGGKATGKYAVDYALGIEDVIIVAPDYPYEPRPSYSISEFFGDIPAIRRALLDMVPSVMLVFDYLSTRYDVDTTHIILLGYSFGAPFVPCVIANDRRAAAGAMVYGGGDLPSLIRHNVRRYEGPVISTLVGAAGGILLHPLEPMRYVGRMAPVPLLMINGTGDEQIPRENAEMLFAAAREPKELVWIPSHHVNPQNVELTRRIIATLRERLVARGVLPR